MKKKVAALRQLPVVKQDRHLWLAVGISVLFHGLLLTVHFQFPDASKAFREKAMDIILVTSETETLRGETERFSQILWDQGIWHALRIWNGWAHDWPYWKQMLGLYLNGSD